MKGIKFNKIARISLAIILILSAIQIMPFEIEIAEKASAGSTWHETDWSGAGSFDAAKSINNSSSPGNLKLVKDTYLYIADNFNHRIVKTKINGDGWTTYGASGTGAGQFSFPSAISYDNTTGYIYVADRANDRIVKTKIDGSGWTFWGTQGLGINEFSDPYGIHYDKDTEFIYVGDTNNHRLVKTQINGNGWQTYGTEGNGTGQFDLLMGVDFDNSSGMGYVYISDYNNHRMVKTNMTDFGWTTLGDTDNPGNGTGQFNWPIGIDFDNSTGTEWIYVGDQQNHRIVKTQMNDSGWMTLGGPISGNGVGKFGSPRGIKYDDRTGYIYVADTQNHRIVRTKMDQSDWLTLGGFSFPFDVDVGNITYRSNGSLISKGFNKGLNAYLQTLSWNATMPPNTGVKFLLRSANSSVNLSLNEFVGPDGTNATYYKISGANIWPGHSDDTWVQYKVILNTTDDSVTPILENVTIKYNLLPVPPTLTSPPNDGWINDNTPMFWWTFTDYDPGNYQTAFQVLIDNDSGFTDPDYNSDNQSSSNGFWQFPMGTSYTTIGDGTWYWKVRTKDDDGNWSKFSNYWIVKIDTQAPTSSISVPIDNGYYNNLDTISGSASDGTGSGLNKVEISIKRQDNLYWNGTDWNSTENWFLASGTSSWTYDSSAVTWSSVTLYTIRSRAADNITNNETAGIGNTFTFETEKPVSSITIPINNTILNSLNTIWGTASDTGGSNVGAVLIRITRDSDNAYWNGSGWNTTVITWIMATGTTAWTCDSSGVAWVSDEQYTLESRATDNVGNWEVLTNWTSFYFDNLDPTPVSILINNDTVYTNSTSVILNLSAYDSGSGVNSVAYSNNGTIWEPWEVYSQYKSHTLPTGDGPKTVYYKVEDLANNTATTSDSIVLDTTPPIGLYIAINGGLPYTNSTNVQLTLAAGDATSGLNRMAFSNDNSTWSAWEPYTDSKSYTLLAGDGQKTVYFKVEDFANNTAIASDTIILDTLPPSPISIVINDNDTYTNSQFVELNLSAVDSGSGVEYMAFSDDGIIWTNWEVFANLKLYVLPAGEGMKTVYLRVRDRANNVALKSDNIYLDTLAPFLSIDINDNATYTNSISVNLNLSADDTGSGVNIMALSNNGTIWTAWEPFNTSKSYTLSEGDGTKTVYFKVEDFSNNTIFTSDSIILDTFAPDPISIVINDDETYTNSTSVQLTLSAVDYGVGSGVYQMAFSTDGTNWGAWELYSTTKSYILSTGDGTKTVHIRVKDHANNIASTSDTIILDVTPPTSLSIVVNDNDTYTKSLLVTLTLNATDALSGIHQMSFSTNSVNWTDWELFNKTKIIPLSAVDGERIIYFRVSDKAGNIGVTNDTIILDTTSPHTLSILINDGATKTDSVNVTLTLSALDDLSGVDQMAFSNNGSYWSDWVDYSETKLYTLPTGDGLKTVYFKVRDLVGNEADPVFDTITLTTEPEVIDTDGDGYPDYADAFPNDAFEWEDTDGDDTGDNTDTDDDNDGYPDEWEDLLGTDVKNATSKPIDTDSDGKPDGDNKNTKSWMDTDDDNDGYTDKEEILAGTDLLNSSDYPVEKEAEDAEDYTLYILLVVVILIIIIILAVAMKSRKKEEPEEEEEE